MNDLNSFFMCLWLFCALMEQSVARVSHALGDSGQAVLPTCTEEGVAQDSQAAIGKSSYSRAAGTAKH